MKHIERISSERRHGTVFMLCVAEMIGIIAGSVAAAAEMNIPSRFFCPFFCGGTLLDVFVNTLAVSMIFLAAAFLSGLFAFGQPVGIALMFGIGSVLGISGSIMYNVVDNSDIFNAVLIILPKAAAFSAVSLLAAREIFRSSSAILGFVSGKEHNNADLRLYCVKFIVLAVIFFIISVADSLMNYIFGNLF